MDPKIGFCSFSARIGAILAPQIDRLADAGFEWAPGLIVTVMSILAGIVWYETKGPYFLAILYLVFCCPKRME